MADKIDFDENDLDNFDFGDDIGSEFDVKDDRTPEAKLFGSIKASLSKNVFGASFIKKTMRESLPEGFQMAMDAEEEVSRELGSLYNNVGDSAAPINKIVKRKTRELLPKLGKFIPASLRKKLEEYSEEFEWSTKSQSEYDREEISDTLKDIFATNVEEAARQRSEDEATENVRADIDEKRFESNARQFAEIRENTRFNRDYLANITYKYQQKSLELQYRQYFIARDSLALNKEMAPLLKEGIAKIAKNTALPDIVKARGKEVFHAMAREGIIRGVQQRAVKGLSNVFGRIGENAKLEFSRMLGDFKDNLELASDQSEMITENIDMMGGYDGLAGEVVGELASDSLAARLGKRLSRRVNQSERLRLLNARLVTMSESLPNMIRNYTESDIGERYDEEGNRSETKAELARLSKKLLMGVGGERVSYSIGDESSLEAKAVEWNMAAHRSLTEIIPGYLARILREQQITRTGDDDTPLTSFNLQRGRFTDYATKARDVARTLIRKDDMLSLRSAIQSTIAEVDKDSVLSEAARADLEKQLFIDSLSGYGMDVGRYIKGDRYSKGIGEESRKEISGLFKQRYGERLKDTREDRTQKQVERARAIREFNRVRDFTPDINDSLTRNVSLGNRELLEELGFLVRRGNKSELNLDKLIQLATTGDLEYYAPDSESDDNYFDYDPSLMGKGFKGVSRKRRLRTRLERAKRAAKTFDYSGAAKGQLAKGKAAFNLRKQQLNDLWKEQGLSRWNAREETFESFKARLTSLKDRGLVSAEEYQQKLQESKNAFKGRVEGLGERLAEGVDLTRDNLKTAQENVRGRFNAVKNRFSNFDVKGATDDQREALYAYADNLAAQLKAKQKKITESEEFVAIKDGVAQAVSEAISAVDKLPGSDETKTASRVIQIKAKRLKRAIRPVYTKAKKEVLLTKEGIMRGQYFDSMTRKVITSMDDIQNAVVDIKGNLVVTKTDLMAGLSETPPVQTVDVPEEEMQSHVVGNVGLHRSLPAKFERFRNLSDSARGIKDELTGKAFDIYVKGETEPRLEGRKLKQGHYFDKSTGKVIKSIKDIKGEVFDKDNNIVLSAEDFKKGLTSPDRRASDQLAAIGIKALGTIPKLYIKASIAYWKFLGRMAFKGVSALGGPARRQAKGEEIVDLYIKGENEPRIFASGMVQNRYFNKEDGSPIKRAGDIKGAVVDSEGNIIVSEKEVSGLMTLNGTPIDRFVSGLKRLAIGSVGLSLFGAPGVAAYALWKGGKTLFTGGAKAFRGLKSLFGRVLGKSMQTGDPVKDYELNLQRTNAESNITIAQILADRLPKPRKRSFTDVDGDGVREGSWMDQLRRRREKEAAGSSTTIIKETSKDERGLLDKLLGRGENGWQNTAMGAAAMWLLTKMKAGFSWVWNGIKGVLGKAGNWLKGQAGKFLRSMASAGKNALARITGSAMSWGKKQLGRMSVQGAKSLVQKQAVKLFSRSAGRVGLYVAAGVALGSLSATAYRRYKEQNRTHLTDFRIAQYGIGLPTQELLQAIFSMEETLKDKVSIGSGDGAIKVSGEELSALAKQFGVDETDENAVNRWMDWYENRFQPVYLGYMSLAKPHQKDRELVELESLDTKDKEAIVTAMHNDIKGRGLYQGRLSPTDNYPAPSDMAMDARLDGVKAAYAEQNKSFVKAAKEDSAITKSLIKDAVTKVTKPFTESRWFSNKEEVPKSETKPVTPRPLAPGQGVLKSGNGNLIMPTDGKITSLFGKRIHPVHGVQGDHKGIDIAGATGNPVYAAADGVIMYQQWMKGYGNVVWLRHPDGNITKYAHLSSFIPGLEPGMAVRQGDLIGRLGNTGVSTGPHLHFEVRGGPLKDSPAFDPLRMLEVNNKAVKDVEDEKRNAKSVLESGAELENDLSEGTDTIVSTVKPPEPNLQAARKQMDIRTSEDLAGQINNNQAQVEERKRAVQVTMASERTAQKDNVLLDRKVFADMQRTLHSQLQTQINMDKTLVQARDLLVEIRDRTGTSEGKDTSTTKTRTEQERQRNKEWTNPVDLRKVIT